jgi:hypothetical protein
VLTLVANRDRLDYLVQQGKEARHGNVCLISYTATLLFLILSKTASSITETCQTAVRLDCLSVSESSGIMPHLQPISHLDE